MMSGFSLSKIGYDLRSAEQDFNEVKSSWILDLGNERDLGVM